MPRPGHVRQPSEQLQDSFQILYMNNERFSVPEEIFRPDDIGACAFSAVDVLLADRRYRYGAERPGSNHSTQYFATSRQPARHVLGKHRADRREYEVSGIQRTIVSLDLISHRKILLAVILLIYNDLVGLQNCAPSRLIAAKSKSIKALNLYCRPMKLPSLSPLTRLLGITSLRRRSMTKQGVLLAGGSLVEIGEGRRRRA